MRVRQILNAGFCLFVATISSSSYGQDFFARLVGENSKRISDDSRIKISKSIVNCHIQADFHSLKINTSDSMIEIREDIQNLPLLMMALVPKQQVLIDGGLVIAMSKDGNLTLEVRDPETLELRCALSGEGMNIRKEAYLRGVKVNPREAYVDLCRTQPLSLGSDEFALIDISCQFQ